MDWKQKIKWKILIILFAVAGILVIWWANQSGEKKQMENHRKSVQENMIRENERASAGIYTPESSKVEGEETSETRSAQTYGDDIREISVLLMNNGYESYTHPSVQIQFQGNYEVNGKVSEDYADGHILELSSDSGLFLNGKAVITPIEAENRAVLLSLQRQQGNPAYRGQLTVYQEDNGVRIVNTLPLEEYLYGVVPSEMPASYEIEALKAQAVCARTYACVQMQESPLENLGAQVDDSVSYQVYQNGGEAETSNQAVNETKGLILTSGGKPITAYYFSTSHGKTSTDEVWEASVPSSYLKSVECMYDASQPWFRWSVTLGIDRLRENAVKNFPDIAEIYEISVEQLGEGEAVLRLLVKTDKGQKEISNEYDIREFLSPEGLSITRQDGSVVKGAALLPSAYFSLEPQYGADGTLSGYEIHGGGYGHGVGMSQNGAKGMAEAGMEYGDILSFFYQNVEVTDMGSAL